MRARSLVTCAAILLVAGMATAADATRWINVHVTEAGSGTNVQVHLPMDLVLTVMDGIKVENFDRGKVDLELDDVEIDLPKILAALKDAPDGQFVTVDADDADVKVSKTGGTLVIHVDEKDEDGAKVDVTVPAGLVDALTVDADNRIDVKQLIARMADLPAGDIVRVDADDAQVRVWIE